MVNLRYITYNSGVTTDTAYHANIYEFVYTEQTWTVYTVIFWLAFLVYY